uniref:Uncharacterized protein n=1 Tax=Oryza punctata TaxID=4537 RepID=A0A0E0LBH4_ORYPU
MCRHMCNHISRSTIHQPATIDTIDICTIKAEAAKRVHRESALVITAATVPSRLELGCVDDDAEFDEMESPKLWAEMAEARLLGPRKWGSDGNDMVDGSSQSWANSVNMANGPPYRFMPKACVRPPFGDWRSRNEKFVTVKNLPKAHYLLRPIYREMVINGNSYKVVNVANWMRTHPGRMLEDYDRVHVARLEGMARFWRNHQRTNRQEATARRRYSLSLVSPPSPLRMINQAMECHEITQGKNK